TSMASESSFDIVSEFDRQEDDNALNQAAKEISNRYDFRGTDAETAWKGADAIELTASTEERVIADQDVFIKTLTHHGLVMKSLDLGKPVASGKGFRLVGSLKQRTDKENAKKITKCLRDEGPKGVKPTIQGEEIRVSSKKRDDLQECISLLKGADFEVALQFTNYR